MNESNAPRKPWLASTLSQVSPGVGHIYCGELVTGLSLYLIGLLAFPVVITLLLFASGLIASWLLLALIAAGLIFAMVAAWHSKRLAKGRVDYQLKTFNRWWIYLLLAIQPAAFAIPIALLVKSHLIEAFYIPTSSMSPNLLPGDRLLVDKRFAGQRVPKRGEVVVFRQPSNRKRNYIKRIIGLPGDEISIDSSGRVSINGTSVMTRQLQPSEVPPGVASKTDSETIIHSETTDDANYFVFLSPVDEGAEGATEVFSTTVPDEHILVLGDNRNNSVDSRKFGTIPIGDVLGPATFIYTPSVSWSRFGRVQ